MVTYKIARFTGMGAVIFLATYFLTDNNSQKLLIAGLVFAGIALLFANIGNILKKKEKYKTRL